MSLRSDMQQNIQDKLNFSATPAGEAREAGREETESREDPSLLLAPHGTALYANRKSSTRTRLSLAEVNAADL
jgi:hypothetical protein